MRDDQFALLIVVLVLGFGSVVCLLLGGGMLLLWVVAIISSFWMLGRVFVWLVDATPTTEELRTFFARRTSEEITGEYDARGRWKYWLPRLEGETPEAHSRRIEQNRARIDAEARR
jgi:hypothetical protein